LTYVSRDCSSLFVDRGYPRVVGNIWRQMG